MNLRAPIADRRLLVLGTLGLLHIWDAWATIYALKRGIGTELNPLMGFTYNLGPEYFLAAKAFLVLWGSVILGFAWERPGARMAAYALLILYAFLGFYEIAVLLAYWILV